MKVINAPEKYNLQENEVSVFLGKYKLSVGAIYDIKAILDKEELAE